MVKIKTLKKDDFILYTVYTDESKKEILGTFIVQVLNPDGGTSKNTYYGIVIMSSSSKTLIGDVSSRWSILDDTFGIWICEEIKFNDE